jgi:hypothetical protein
MVVDAMSASAAMSVERRSMGKSSGGEGCQALSKVIMTCRKLASSRAACG